MGNPRNFFTGSGLPFKHKMTRAKKIILKKMDSNAPSRIWYIRISRRISVSRNSEYQPKKYGQSNVSSRPRTWLLIASGRVCQRTVCIKFASSMIIATLHLSDRFYNILDSTVKHCGMCTVYQNQMHNLHHYSHCFNQIVLAVFQLHFSAFSRNLAEFSPLRVNSAEPNRPINRK